MLCVVCAPSVLVTHGYGPSSGLIAVIGGVEQEIVRSDLGKDGKQAQQMTPKGLDCSQSFSILAAFPWSCAGSCSGMPKARPGQDMAWTLRDSSWSPVSGVECDLAPPRLGRHDELKGLHSPGP